MHSLSIPDMLVRGSNMRNINRITFTVRDHMLHGVRNRRAIFQPQHQHTAQASNVNHSEQPQTGVLGHPSPQPRVVRNISSHLQTSHTPFVANGAVSPSSFAATGLFTNWHSPEIYSHSEQAPLPAQTPSPNSPRLTALMRLRAQPVTLLTPAQIAARQSQLVESPLAQDVLINSQRVIIPPPVAPKSEKVLSFIKGIKEQAKQNQAEKRQRLPDLAAIKVVEECLDSVIRAIEAQIDTEESQAVAMPEAKLSDKESYLSGSEAESTCSGSSSLKKNPLFLESIKKPKDPS